MPTSEHFKRQPRVTLPGTEQPDVASLSPAIAAHATAPEAPAAEITVTVILQPANSFDPAIFTDPAKRIRREDLASVHGPDPVSVTLLSAFAEEFGLAVAPHPGAGARSFLLTGSEAAMQEAFAVTLTHQTVGPAQVRIRTGAIQLPEELSGHIAAVLGLDSRPVAKSHCRRAANAAAATSYTPVQVARLYGFPANVSAEGQTIGLIELGGGFRPADITAYFASLELPVPKVTAVSVDQGKNKPGDASGADGEVMLDIEVAAAVASGAGIVVYFAPNTSQGFVDAISTAVHDTTHKPSVISISWGGPESTWTASAANALDEACQAAAAAGVSITVAAGDNGSSDGVTTGGNHVDFPASSPHVLACGGTKLSSSGSSIESEVVWNEDAGNEGATGGGFSTLFPRPAWQTLTTLQADGQTGRGVPDAAGDADPETGYQIRVDGQSQVIGGTSAVAPLWAGLIALANQANGTDAGFLTPTLYTHPAAFRDITEGNNGAWTAGPGWDPCTGLGSPIGTAIIAALKPAAR